MRPYFKELLQIFNDETVEYLVVGAHAVMHYTEPRYTKDHDVWVRPAEENAHKVFRSLATFGVPMADVDWKAFAEEGSVFQIGTAGERIDVITQVDGLTFVECWKHRVDFEYSGVLIHILSRCDLIANKKAVGRGQDLLDVEKLEKADDGEP